MKKHIVIFFVVLSLFLLIPLFWSEKVEFNWSTFTEEYYKQLFSLMQLLIASFFFTVLYQYEQERKLDKKLTNIKNRVEILINELIQNKPNISRELVSEIESKIDIYILYFSKINNNEDSNYVFYSFIQKINYQITLISNTIDNKDGISSIIDSIELKYNSYKTAINKI